MNKFKVGQKYKVLKPMPEAGNVIEITEKEETIYYKTVSGNAPVINCFNINSSMAKTSELISEPEENEESERNIAKVGDYIRILDNANLSKYSSFKKGDVVKVLSTEPNFLGETIVRLSNVFGDFLYPTEYEILHDYKPEKEEIIKILMSVGLTHEDLVKIALYVLLGGIEDGK